jgi:hypothetical protein
MAAGSSICPLFLTSYKAEEIRFRWGQVNSSIEASAGEFGDVAIVVFFVAMSQTRDIND